ncbi:MAG: hypothetical protein JSW50_15815 [Candidatus Latescibacterota bacterium]|nr:MAG: hypothetical protein JSW50_15815 [Candidatus Latescibacterota bacterium]
MQRLELIHSQPVTTNSHEPFDFRISAVGGAPAAVSAENGFDASDLHQALDVDPPRLLGPIDRPVVLRGHRRIGLARSLGLDVIPFLVYPPGTPRNVVTEIVLAGEPARFSGVETIIAMAKTITYATKGIQETVLPLSSPIEEDFPDWLDPPLAQLLGRKVSKRFAARLSTALTWPTEDLYRLHCLSLSSEQIASLIDLSTSERQIVLKIRDAVPLTAGELKTLTRLVILARGRKHVELDGWARRVLDKSSEPPTGSDIQKSLRAETHPNLSRAETSIANAISELALPNRLRINPPENLEGGSFSCYFRFSNDRELGEHVAKLEKIIKDGSAQKIIDLLDRGDADEER